MKTKIFFNLETILNDISNHQRKNYVESGHVQNPPYQI